MKSYRVLLLGIGFIGKQWIRTIQSEERCKLVAVSGDLPAGATLASIGLDDEVAYYADYREAIEKTEADFVIIAIPTRFHTDAAKLALEKGMHILSEKPLGVDEEDLAALSGEFASELEGFFKLHNRLFEVDDVNLVAGTEDVLRHLGVPETGLVAEVATSFEHFAHANGHF